METHVLTFTITKSFSDWVKVYDESLPFQKTVGITSLYRGVSKDDPTKVCAVMQAMPGVLEQFIADNTELITSSGHVLESTVTQVFLAS
jgi:hypothetical protein